MKKIIIFINIVVFVLSCAKLESPVENKAHPEDWTDPQSTEFHANKVIAVGTISCVSCHGPNLAQSQSLCIQCHQKQDRAVSYPHPEYWTDFKSSQNHGQFVKQNEGTLTCNNCHEGQNDQATPCANCHVGS